MSGKRLAGYLRHRDAAPVGGAGNRRCKVIGK